VLKSDLIRTKVAPAAIIPEIEIYGWFLMQIPDL